MTAKADRCTVLILDNDPAVAAALGSVLDRAHFRVAVAAGPRDGIRELRRFPYDIALIPSCAPDGGAGLCALLRQIRDVALVVLGTCGSAEEAIRALDAGADDYVPKPIDPPVLAARLRAILRRTAGRQRTVRAEELELDFRTRNARVKGEDVFLTRTEFNLLELFLAHPGQTLSREFIRSSNWGASELYTQSRTIDVHIQRLRRKIEPVPEKPRYILTVTGVGYRCETGKSFSKTKTSSIT